MPHPKEGISPAEQILRSETEVQLVRSRVPGELRGKVFLFNHSHAVYDPSSGLIEIVRGKSEKEIAKDTIELEEGLTGKMDLETAISQTLRVANEFALKEGASTKRDRRILEKIVETLGWWDQTPLSEEERQQREEEVRGLLEQEGYVTARDPHRKQIAQNLQAGVDLDSRGRINPSAKKTQVAVAYRRAYRRGNKNRAIFVKYGLQLLPDLVQERITERKRLGLASVQIQNVLDIPQWHTNSYPQRVRSLINRLPTILPPWIIRVAPYNLGMENVLNLLPELIQHVGRYSVAPNVSRDAIDHTLRTVFSQLTETLELAEEKMREKQAKREERFRKERETIPPQTA